MLLYRAINDRELKHYLNGENLTCTLYDNYMEAMKKNRIVPKLIEYYHQCMRNKREYALNVIMNQVLECKLKKRTEDTIGSPWVPLTDDLDFTMTEYAIPQASASNFCMDRKPVIAVSILDNMILSTSEEIKAIKEDFDIEYFGVDLTNDNLKKYYIYGGINPEKYTKGLPGYRDRDPKLKTSNITGRKPRLSEMSSYKDSNDFVLFKQVNFADIKIFMYPLLQDIIYGCNIDIYEYYDMLVNRIDEFNAVINEAYKYYSGYSPLYSTLYPNFIGGTNLTDYLIDNYSSIEGNNIEEKYNRLKKDKLYLLEKIVETINKFFDIDLKVTRLIDDSICVSSFENLGNINNQRDLLVINKEDKLYKYSRRDFGYICDSEIIKNYDIKKLIKKQ